MQLLVLICCSVMTVQALSAATVLEKVTRWPAGKRIQIVFISGDKLVGVLGPVTSEGFIVNPIRNGPGVPRTIQFAEVRSVNSKWTTGEKWLAAGAIYAGLTVFFALTLGR